MSYLKSSPGETDLRDVFVKFPQRSVKMLRLIDDIMRGESALSAGERELIFAFCSSQNSCQFCYSSHQPVAGALGVDESIFPELERDIDSARVDERLKPVLHYARKLTLHSSQITQKDVDAIYAAGWNEQAFLDIVSVCAIANFFNRIVDGVGVDVSSEQARDAGNSTLNTIGYAGLADRLEAME